MAIPLITSLGKSVARNLPIIRGGVAQGLSGNQIGALIRASGERIGRQPLQAAIRAIKNIDFRSGQLRTIRATTVPNIKSLPEAITRIKANFSYIVEVRGLDPATGLNIVQPVTVTSSTNLSRAVIEAKAQAAVAKLGEKYSIQIESAQLLTGVRKGLLGAGP